MPYVRSALALLLGLNIGLLSGQAATVPLVDRLARPSPVSGSIADSAFTDIQARDGRLLIVGEGGRVLLRAADGSQVQADVPVDLLLTAVHFVDAQHGWVVGHDGVVLHSADGGHTWSRQLDGVSINRIMQSWAESEVARLEAAQAADPDDEALAEALDSAIFALDDIRSGGEAGPSHPLLDVWFRSDREGWVVGAYGTILHTRDGGSSWALVPGLDNPERLHLNAVLGLADGSLLVAGEGGRLYRSEDSGGHWQPASQLADASLYHLLQLRDGRLLALGFGGVLLSSLDQGRSWEALEVPVRVSLYGGSQLADGSLLLAGHGGVLLYSRDGRAFRVWRGERRGAWMGAVEADAGTVALIGSHGLRILPLDELEGQLQ
ncbi:YCF48-related protein [Zestomonas carbonaria]|uniref:Ycf48-like protein n=1 Tax=Zestomonas carbonaria TaxID=2762745 RepID=A0A7U7IBJ1_9GAMM|nr:YCF48-related protein [Pseudomonas carbonaria]CAD5109941.1 Ycf48-like protein [Pseudomonas carbonaria]